MEYDNELSQLTGFDFAKFDGVTRCTECGIELDHLNDICDSCGCNLLED